MTVRAVVAVEEVEAEMDNALSSEQLHPLLQTPTEDWSSLVETPVSRPVIPPETPCRPSSGPVGEALLGFNQEEEFEEDLPFDDEEDDMPVDDIRGLSPFLLPIPSPSAAATVGAVIEVDMLEDITEEDIADYILPPEEVEQKTLWWKELHKSAPDRMVISVLKGPFLKGASEEGGLAERTSCREGQETKTIGQESTNEPTRVLQCLRGGQRHVGREGTELQDKL